MKNIALMLLASALLLTACDPTPKAPAAQSELTSATVSVAPVPEPAPSESYARANPTGGEVAQVAVEAVGQGPNLSTAVQSAIRSAIVQVNGESIDASSTSFLAGFAATAGDDPLTMSSAGFAELVSTKSRGAITGFQLISQQSVANNQVEAKIRATVAKYRKPVSADRLSIVIAPIRTKTSAYIIDQTRVPAEAISAKIRNAVTEAFLHSGRVTVLDREFGEQTDSELALIEAGSASHDDFAKLGQKLTASLVLVSTIERFAYQRHEQSLRSSDRQLVSHSGGAQITIRLINTATSQIELGDTLTIDLPRTEPTTLGNNVDVSRIEALLESELASQMSLKVLSKLFPITIVQLDHDDVVLSQGAPALDVGQVLEVVVRGKELFDPQTHASLGRIEKPCCTVRVTKTTDSVAYGVLERKDIDVAAAFQPGALEVAISVPSTQNHASEPRRPEVSPAGKRKANKQDDANLAADKKPVAKDPNADNW